MGALVSPVNAMRVAGPEANNEACVCLKYVCVSDRKRAGTIGKSQNGPASKIVGTQ